jgi:hypothetical protein
MSFDWWGFGQWGFYVLTDVVVSIILLVVLTNTLLYEWKGTNFKVIVQVTTMLLIAEIAGIFLVDGNLLKIMQKNEDGYNSAPTPYLVFLDWE